MLDTSTLDTLRDTLRRVLPATPLMQALAPVLAGQTGLSSSGYPYLQPSCYHRLRDRVPIILAWGPEVIAASEQALALAAPTLAPEALESARRAAQVIAQVVNTAAITAPSDLWLLRLVLSTFDGLGLSQRLLDGERLNPRELRDAAGRPLLAEELKADLELLRSRRLIFRESDGYGLSGDPSARRALELCRALPDARPAGLSGLWAQAFRGEPLAPEVRATLLELGHSPPRLPDWSPGPWTPGPEAIELGYRLVPLVVGMRAAGALAPILKAGAVRPEALPEGLEAGVMGLLQACGVIDAAGRLSATGARTLARGPGPFGIIEAYSPYLQVLPQVLREGRGGVHVERTANIAASQTANRRTFTRANDSLDRFCADTGFRYRVFVEHAVGKGEATRQRWERDGDALTYVGADLEDATIDAALLEQAAGRLPADMRFVRRADIGRPESLVSAMQAMGVPTEGAVMVVGNGFHEARGLSDAGMVEVFRGYERAGLVLLFTEESALATRDLLETAWNTYHAGFRYVHERSGQGLRPADPQDRIGELPMSWTECAEAAGYVRLEAYCSRSRTIYPAAREGKHNPSISVGHFFVPGRVQAALSPA
ncbi:MAG: hypothetical protein H6741_20155 [Alphaproteobacteria bacterium]|nr:hypothetical protein [Alphaproteobacteria bacterium]